MEAYRVESTDCTGYHLFQRAIAERDEDAWAEIVARYRPLLIAWARFRCIRISIEECCEDIADQALARAWAALAPARFASFPNLAALLAYLRSCVSATIVDCARAEAVRRRGMRRLEGGVVASSEQIVLDQIEREELWRILMRLAATTQEQTILVESFVLHLPPRVIQVRHPDLFTNVMTIYNAKRSLLDRFRRSRELQRLYLEVV